MTPNDTDSTLLFCLIGLSPAVLTETVWALANRRDNPILPDRIIALTTVPGKTKLVEALFENRGWERFRTALTDRLGESLAGRLRFGNISESIRVFPSAEQDRELDDIRSEEDSRAVAEFLMETVRAHAGDEELRIIASIAGGRKTSGALLHSVMTLLGRDGDLITHVIVDEPFDRVPQFLFPGYPETVRHPDTGEPLDTRKAELHLTEIPFVPVRYLFERDLQRAAGSYLRLMGQLRHRAVNLSRDLEIRLNPARGNLIVNGTSVPCSALEFAFYLYFAQRAKDNSPELPGFTGIDEPLKELAGAWKQDDDFGHWSHQVLERTIDVKEDPRRWADNLRRQLRNLRFDAVEIDRIVPRRGRFSIELPPESIHIE